MPFVDNNSDQFHQRIQEHHETDYQEFTIDPPTQTSLHGHNRVEISDKGYHPQRLLDHDIYPFAQDNGTLNMGQIGQTFGMDEPFVYGGQNVNPFTNISSNHITEDAFELPIMDSLMVQNFSAFRQELEMDYNGSWQSLVLDVQGHNHQVIDVFLHWTSSAFFIN